jgi:hypothetical protein
VFLPEQFIGDIRLSETAHFLGFETMVKFQPQVCRVALSIATFIKGNRAWPRSSLSTTLPMAT